MQRSHDHVSWIKQRRGRRRRKEKKEVKTLFCRYVIMTSGHRMVVKMTQMMFQKYQVKYVFN